MPAPSDNQLTDEQCLARIAEVRKEVTLPGFWATFAQNCSSWAQEISACPFWQEANKRLDSWRAEYRAATGDELRSHAGLPTFEGKSEKSIKDKLFRRIRADDQYRGIDADGPPIVDLNDLVRTRISCRYIDGVEFLAQKLTQLANDLGVEASIDKQGRIEGYFAQHVSVRLPVIYRFGGAVTVGQIECEVQLASDMATQMWITAHPLYERIRGSPTGPEVWQWKWDDPRFISHQLGHMIHLADGLLVQLRESLRTKV